MENKLVSKLITGLGIAASLTTSGVAGWKVLASINENPEVPEAASPMPTPEVTASLGMDNKNTDQDSEPEVPAANPLASPLPTKSPVASVAVLPSATPSSTKFPTASAIINGKFNDDNDDELEVEEEHEDEKDEKDEEDEQDD